MSRLVRIAGESSWNVDVHTFERYGSGTGRCVDRHGLGASPEPLGEVYDDVRALVAYAFRNRSTAESETPDAGAAVIDMFDYLTLARGGSRS